MVLANRFGARRYGLREDELRLRANMTILRQFDSVNIFRRAVNANTCFWQNRAFQKAMVPIIEQ